MKLTDLSIKTRLTLYYSAAMTIICVLVMGTLLFTADRQVNLVSEDTITEAVQDSFEEIECRGDTIEINSDFDIYEKGVTLLVYDEKGRLVTGSIPADFPVHTPLENHKYQKTESGEQTWLSYDVYTTYENGQSLWVRGIYNMDNTVKTIRFMIGAMFVLLPLIILIAILIGRRITGHAFQPIKEITRAADNIGKNRNLSDRLPKGEHRDELYYLTETLNLMIERLENAFNAEKEFSSDVSHELKTPVSVILAECEYTLQKKREPEEYVESIETIQNQCRKTMSLIQQLLQLSRTMDTDKIIEKENFDLSVLCSSVSEEMGIMAEKKNIRMVTEIEPGISIQADETLIMRMLINLISNSIKYSRDTEDRWIKLSLEKHGEKTEIKVSDNGKGIDRKDIKNIFNRFYKVDKSRRRDEESFGLGLSMVKWIVDAHKGEIAVESIPDVGTEFTILL